MRIFHNQRQNDWIILGVLTLCGWMAGPLVAEDQPDFTDYCQRLEQKIRAESTAFSLET